jgi:hypothetical protein
LLEKEFSEESTEVDPTFDWIAEAKRRKLVALEDNNIRYNRYSILLVALEDNNIRYNRFSILQVALEDNNLRYNRYNILLVALEDNNTYLLVTW